MNAVRTLVLIMCAAVATLARAHGDEDHGHEPPKAPAGPPTAVISGGDASPQRLPDGSIYVPKAAQRVYSLRTVAVVEEALPGSVELKGQVIADPATAGRVQATQAGIVQPGPRGLPQLGQRVARGEVLAYLAPQASGLERAATQSQLAELNGLRVVAEQKAQRLAQLEGSVPQKEIDAARAEVASLTQRKLALGAGLVGRTPLTSPVSGVISGNNVVAGQVVDARELLFEIVQPDRLLVQALAYDTRIGADIESAAGLTASKDVLPLRFLGAGLQLREQAVPLQFRINPPLPPLALGESVTVVVATRSRVKGYAVAQMAVTRSATNETMVWVHESAERFRPRKVQVQALDATRSVVTAGLASGERVVVQGAALLAQVR